ncbi:hypothetical protein D271_01572 [Ligilactobacillus saerimneri 30a]|uniref:Uncharacterized protein n=1 Tax=Ligilactobacillus saerimneri 30a TaxID=1227363 RepID=M5J824_9LACO|nr:hypothetical protein D271_01572 [Ligilactobacillus saerimneri 30a]
MLFSLQYVAMNEHKQDQTKNPETKKPASWRDFLTFLELAGMYYISLQFRCNLSKNVCFSVLSKK